MLLLKMVNFCKNASCPSSENLLGLINHELSLKAAEKIGKHLEECEFCASEIELYEHFSQNDEVVPETKIPTPLYQLAEALLGNKQKNFSLLNKLMNDNESLTLNQA
jgi:hypothetical protein